MQKDLRLLQSLQRANLLKILYTTTGCALYKQPVVYTEQMEDLMRLRSFFYCA